MKKNDKVLSVKMSEEELQLIKNAAENHHETQSSYARRILVESASESLNTNKDVLECLLGISYDLQRLSLSNADEVINQINKKGAIICQILSTK